jgi:hypothetical protein
MKNERGEERKKNAKKGKEEKRETTLSVLNRTTLLSCIFLSLLL